MENETINAILGRASRFSRLEVIDRATGEVERIMLDDANASASIRSAADRLGIRLVDAWDALVNGEHLTTTGFVRRLV